MKIKNSEINANKIFSKKRTKYDIIEKKVIELNKIKKNTNDIKKCSIKQFIYSNKNVPKIWKTKKTYKNLVLQIFANDNNFLKYLGTNVENDKNLNTNINIQRPKTSISEGKIIPNIDLNKKKELAYNRFQETKTKIRTLISPQIEIENYFEDLNEKYPIKEKLIQLFPYYNLEDDKNNKERNYSYDNSKKLKIDENSIVKGKFKKIRKMEKNIYNNLFPKTKNLLSVTTGFSRSENDDFDFRRKNRIKLMKKELNDPKIFNLLQNLNLYGPYFSYCPPCYGKNINFYKNIGKKQCISLLNYIKNDTIKNREIQEKRFRNNLKYKTNIL